MAKEIFGTLIWWVIGILFAYLLLSAYFSNFFPATVTQALGIKKFTPGLENEDIKQDDSLPASTLSAQDRFINEISMYDKSGQCLLQYTSLGSLENELLHLYNYQDGIMIRIGKKVGKEETGTIELHPAYTKDKKLQLCVIEPQGFYDCYLSGKNQCDGQTYKDIDSAILTSEGIVFSTDCTFLIGGGCYSCGITSSDCYPLKGDILFKPSADKICFIPTHRGDALGRCDAEEKSIDDDCISKINIPSCRSNAGIGGQ